VPEDVSITGELPQIKDIQWVDKQYRFNGKWIPDVDASLIGPENFAELQNFRYNDLSIEGVNGYTRINETYVIDGGAVVGAGGTYLKIRNGHQLRTNRTTTSHILVHAVDGSSNGRVFLNNTRVDTAGEFNDSVDLDVNGNPYFADASASLEGRFSDAPQQSIVYCNAEESLIYAGDEQRVASAFLVQGTPTLTDAKNPKDVTDEINNSLTTDKATFSGLWGVAATGGMLLLTTRPIQALKVYINQGDENTDNNDSLTVKTWTGAGFGGDLVSTDGTIADGQSLRQTGTITLSSHTYGTSVLMHYQELYLYAYLIQSAASALDASIYQITVDMAMQPLQNVWDGVYRQPIQFQVYDATDTAYQDYTLHVNQSSDLTVPVGGDLSAIGAAGDKVIIMFEERAAAIRYTMLGGLVNSNSITVTVKYWDGDSYVDTTATDGTSIGGKTFGQSGLMSWNSDSITGEEPQTLFGSYGYAYELTFSGAMSGTAKNQDVLIDICTGVPASIAVKPFKFSALYQDRLMLGGFTAGGEGNRMDFSIANAPDVFNGFESSANGVQSLYFGGEESLTCATQLYNRFGSNIFSMLMVFKDSEIYILTGSQADEFTIYPVSQTVGCPAPLTLATAEVGLEVGKGVSRNVALWLSHYGPMMFDGASLQPIPGINNYFDPNEAEYIEWDNIDKARGWVDQTYKEYNLLIPSGSGQTTNNIWLVYDLLRQKWTRKDTGAAQSPQAAWNVMDVTTGEQKVYGGIDTGYMVELEDGTTWNATFGTGTDGTGIEQKVRTGDFFPSENIWDFVTLRKLKILCKKLPASASSTNLQIVSWGNAAESGSNVIFQDSDAAAGVNVDFEDMDVDSDSVNETEWSSASAGIIDLSLNIGQTRIIRLIQDLNTQGWVHAWEFVVTTTDALKGWQPLVWGVQFYVSRKDNKATQ
jgi:hypothetical protein